MNNTWLSLSSFPVQGQTVTIDDQDFWKNCFREFSVSCEILDPIVASVLVLPQENGILFKGKLQGKVTLPCDRCTEPAEHILKASFESYENYPNDPYYKSEEDTLSDGLEDEAVIRINPGGHGIDINPAALAWQEFCLTLPVKPLCSATCKGICIHCGASRNLSPCSCTQENEDPRMKILRDLKIKN